MGLKLSIDIGDLEKANDSLKSLSIKASDIRDAGDGIRLIIQQDVDFRFHNAPGTEEGGEVYGGVNWRSLGESYLAQNPRRLGGQILRDTGELMQSLTAQGHPYNVFEAGNSEIVFGTALAKASRLQRDRPFIFWHPILLEKVAQYLANWLGG
jgi:hypothetical protein